MEESGVWRGGWLAGLAVVGLMTAAPRANAEVAAAQKGVALGYERLETLALRIADATAAADPDRAEQMRVAIADARTRGVGDRFDTVVRLLEAERYAAARRDQSELAAQLEELLRVLMADPSEARREEQRLRLERLRREIRGALREQRGLRWRAGRGETAKLADRQKALAQRVERLFESADEAERLAGRTRPASGPQAGENAPRPEGENAEGGASISENLRSSRGAMRKAIQKLRADDAAAEADQVEAQRALEAAQREAEERLRQLREEELQRRLASLAERLRRMHETQIGLVAATRKQIDEHAGGQKTETDRSRKLAAVKLAERQSAVVAAAEQTLRLVRADGKSLVFDEALSSVLEDMRAADARLRAARLDPTTVAIEQSVVDALAEMITAVDESLDELERSRAAQKPDAPRRPSADRGLVSQIGELRMTRALQSRLLRQTRLWLLAADSGDATDEEVAERLAELAQQQRRLSQAIQAIAGR